MCFVTAGMGLGVLRVRGQQVALSCQRLLWRQILASFTSFQALVRLCRAADTVFVLHLLLNTPFAKNKRNFRNNCIHLNDKTSF